MGQAIDLLGRRERIGVQDRPCRAVAPSKITPHGRVLAVAGDDGAVREHIKSQVAQAELGVELRNSDLDTRLAKLRQSSGSVTARAQLDEMKRARTAATQGGVSTTDGSAEFSSEAIKARPVQQVMDFL